MTSLVSKMMVGAMVFLAANDEEDREQICDAGKDKIRLCCQAAGQQYRKRSNNRFDKDVSKEWQHLVHHSNRSDEESIESWS